MCPQLIIMFYRNEGVIMKCRRENSGQRPSKMSKKMATDWIRSIKDIAELENVHAWIM